MRSPDSHSSGGASGRTVRLPLPGGPVELGFSSGLEPLADLIERLWSHVIDDPGEARPGHENALRLAYATEPELHDAQQQSHGIDARVVRSDDAYGVSGDVTLAVIKQLVGSRLMLHAGTVRHPEHGTIIVVGRSGAGKSTATRTLAEDGVYVTDELTILDPCTHEVSPFPKPVSLIERDSSDSSGRRKRDRSLDALGLTPASGDVPAPAHLLLLNRRAADGADAAAAPSLRRVPMAEALVEIVKQSSSAWETPGGLGAIARLIDRCGGALEATYTDAHQIDALLADAPAPVHEEWTAVEQPAADHGAPPPGTFSTTPFSSAVLVGDSAVVLGSSSVVHLQGISALVWVILVEEGALAPEAVEAATVEEMGAHADSSMIIDRALERLLDSGLAQRD